VVSADQRKLDERAAYGEADLTSKLRSGVREEQRTTHLSEVQRLAIAVASELERVQAGVGRARGVLPGETITVGNEDFVAGADVLLCPGLSMLYGRSEGGPHPSSLKPAHAQLKRRCTAVIAHR
jgi:hypothetical protein